MRPDDYVGAILGLNGCEIRLRLPLVFLNPFKLIWVVQILAQKYFRFHQTQITGLISAIPFRVRGRWPSSRTLGRDAVDVVGTVDEWC
jgi:hypothetical protein